MEVNRTDYVVFDDYTIETSASKATYNQGKHMTAPQHKTHGEESMTTLWHRTAITAANTATKKRQVDERLRANEMSDDKEARGRRAYVWTGRPTGTEVWSKLVGRWLEVGHKKD